MTWMDTVRTVWPTVARTDEWAGGWTDGYILEPCQGPEDHDTTAAVQYLGTAIAPAPTRQDKTRQACWAQQAVAGWVVPSFARCDLGRYLAGCRAASGIVRYLDCTLWVAAVPWPGALALELDLGPGGRGERGREMSERESW